MLEILYRLRRLMLQHHLVPGNIKITVEFLDPETQYRAERVLRTNTSTLDPFCDPKMIAAVCDGQPFQIMDIPIQVKRFEYPKPTYTFFYDPGCPCSSCEAARVNAAFRK